MTATETVYRALTPRPSCGSTPTRRPPPPRRPAEHGVRITAASVAAAHRLRSRQDGGGPAPAPRIDQATAVPAAPRTARLRRRRTPPAAVDPETLIRRVVGEIQNASNAEAERLRDAMRRAIDVLQVAVRA